MTAVVPIPSSLDEGSFEQVAAALAAAPADAKVLVDARHARWASPYGLTALLAVAQARAVRPSFAPPEGEDTLSYWGRAGFFQHAETVYDFTRAVPKGKAVQESNALLPITRIATTGDVHEIVARVGERSTAILRDGLGLDLRATMRFSMTLSEACQNVTEHAGCDGWVAVQSYTWRQRLGRRVVVIAVCDAGVGFRRSLESNAARPRSDRWDDGMALEEGVLRNVSRFRDTGRGQGIANIRSFVTKFDGKLAVRSGTARIALVPDWDDDVALREGLAPFPGAQVQITIPQAVAAAAPDAGGRGRGAAKAAGGAGAGDAPTARRPSPQSELL